MSWCANNAVQEGETEAGGRIHLLAADNKDGGKNAPKEPCSLHLLAFQPLADCCVWHVFLFPTGSGCVCVWFSHTMSVIIPHGTHINIAPLSLKHSRLAYLLQTHFSLRRCCDVFPCSRLNDIKTKNRSQWKLAERYYRYKKWGGAPNNLSNGLW